MAGTVVHAFADEPLDSLIWRELGTSAVEAVLAANPGLAEIGPFLPEGQPVLLPEAAEAPASTAELVQLWN